MTSSIMALARRITRVERELAASRVPQLDFASVQIDETTEVSVVEGIQTALAADTAASAAREAADQAALDAADAAAAGAIAQSSADAAAAAAASVRTDVDGIPAQIAAAKTEAITTAAGTAQSKADAAQAAAVSAAAADAASRASAAQSAATAAAAADAKAKADAAEAAAKAAAKTYSDTVASGAKADAISAAATDAKAKADAAQAAAIASATADAKAKADAAQAAAIAAAATDAQTKADVAKAAAINAAATDAKSKADAAQANAIASAATTAQTKADAAKQAAIDAATLDAKAKADAAQSAATTAAAADAKAKADAAQAAAQAAAKTYSDTVASGAQSAAISAAAADAKSKADAAEAAAKTAAAADAKAKADAAQAAAIAAAATDAKTKADLAEASAINAGQTYVQARGTDLVTNGTGFMGDATNFSSAFTFNGADAPTGANGSFVAKFTVAGSAFLSETIPYDPSKSYRLACQLRQTVAGAASRAYGFVAPYDVGNNSISPLHYMWIAGTMTTLAADLKPGDTTIKIANGANWWGSSVKPASTTSYLRSMQFWNYVDSKGKAWGPGTYTRNTTSYDAWADGGLDLATGVITLRSAWAGPLHPAGTAVSNGTSGGSYMYMPSLTNAVVPETWTAYADTLTAGTMTPAQQQAPSAGAATWGTGVPPGTAKLLIGWLLNYAPTAGRHAVAAVSFSDASAANYAANNITETQILPDAITSPKIKAGAIIAGKIATDAVAANNVQANAIIAGKIATDAVAANNIQANAIVAGKIAADGVLATNIVTDAILARHIKVGQITADKLVAGTITAASGVIGSIDAAKITVNKITAAQMAVGTITAASGIIGDIDAATITVGKISASQLAADAIDGKTITGSLIRSAASGPRVELTGGGTGGKFSVFTASANEVTPGGMSYYGGGGYNGVIISNSVFKVGATNSFAPRISMATNESTGAGDFQVQTSKTWVYYQDSIGGGLAGKTIGSKVGLEAQNNAGTDLARIALFGEGDPYVDGIYSPGISLYTPKDVTANARQISLNATAASGKSAQVNLMGEGVVDLRGVELNYNGTALPLGWLGGDRRVTNSGSTSSTTEAGICSVTIPVKAGHKYRITGWSNLQSSVAGDGAGLRYKVNGSTVALAQVYLPIAGTSWPSTDTVIWTSNVTGSVLFETAVYRVRGTGTIFCYANASQASYLDIEHIGSA